MKHAFITQDDVSSRVISYLIRCAMACALLYVIVHSSAMSA